MRLDFFQRHCCAQVLWLWISVSLFSSSHFYLSLSFCRQRAHAAASTDRPEIFNSLQFQVGRRAALITRGDRFLIPGIGGIAQETRASCGMKKSRLFDLCAPGIGPARPDRPTLMWVSQSFGTQSDITYVCGCCLVCKVKIKRLASDRRHAAFCALGPAAQWW